MNFLPQPPTNEEYQQLFEKYKILEESNLKLNSEITVLKQKVKNVKEFEEIIVLKNEENERMKNEIQDLIKEKAKIIIDFSEKVLNEQKKSWDLEKKLKEYEERKNVCNSETEKRYDKNVIAENGEDSRKRPRTASMNYENEQIILNASNINSNPQIQPPLLVLQDLFYPQEMYSQNPQTNIPLILSSNIPITQTLSGENSTCYHENPGTGKTKSSDAQKAGPSALANVTTLSKLQKNGNNKEAEDYSLHLNNLRTSLKKHVADFYSLNHCPKNIFEIPQENPWFLQANARSRCIAPTIFKGNFHEPLPVLKDGEAVFASTSDDQLLYILRKNYSSVIIVAVGEVFFVDALNESFFHGSMVCRDEACTSIKCYIYDGLIYIKERLIILSAINMKFTMDVDFVPSKVEIPNDTSLTSLLNLFNNRNGKLETQNKKVLYYCCCNRPYMNFLKDRNWKLENQSSVQCCNCMEWYFFKCVAFSDESEDFYCKNCSNKLPEMYEHCNLHDCEFNNTCLIDSFLTASLLYDKQNENCLSKTIKTYESKNVAENAFLHLLLTDKSFSKRSKHIFLKKLFKDQRNLFGDEENIVLKHFKHRYLIYGTTEPEDCMFFERVLNSVEETIIKSMQPENMSIVKVCCNKTVEVLNKRFVDDIPWILPLRPLDFPILRDFTPNMIELIPLTVEVVNSGETITYKLGLISFALIGHFIGLIPSKEGWILFDSFKDPILLHLRDAIQRVTAQGGLINTLYYYVSIE